MSQSKIAPGGFAALIGAEFLDFDPDRARARLAVEPHHLQPFGIVHGGVYASLAESLCSTATYLAVSDHDKVALGMANASTFLRSIAAGHVNAVAVARHRGSTTWVWDVELSDDDERVCALVRMTVAVRPRREPGSS